MPYDWFHSGIWKKQTVGILQLSLQSLQLPQNLELVNVINVHICLRVDKYHINLCIMDTRL